MSDVLKRFNDLSGKVFIGDSYRSSPSSNRFDVIDPECEPQDFWWFPYADAEMFPDN